MLQSYRTSGVVVLLLAGTMAGQHTPGDFDQLVVRQLGSSRVMEHLFHLTDAIGPRVVGSPALEAARGWLEAAEGVWPSIHAAGRESTNADRARSDVESEGLVVVASRCSTIDPLAGDANRCSRSLFPVHECPAQGRGQRGCKNPKERHNDTLPCRRESPGVGQWGETRG